MTRVKLSDINVGDTVMVRGGFGRDPAVAAIVEEVESDIKNGMPGISYTPVKGGEGRWAYLGQVDRVVAKAKR